PNVSNTNAATSLAAGDYEVTVSDDNACEVIEIITINQPPALGLNAVGSDALCFEENSGTVTATVTGGSGIVSYAISNDGINFQSSPDGNFADLYAGSYTVVAIDQNFCTDTVTVDINEPSILGGTISAVDASCFGYTDGQIIITASGGTPGYEYAITSETNNSGIFSGLGIGIYLVTVTDANNCSYSETVEILQPDLFLITVAPDSTTINMGDTIQ